MSKSTSRPRRATAKAKTSRAPKLGLVHGSADWILASVLPEHTNWVLIVIDGKTRDVPDHIGLGWRKRDSAGRATGWWETSHGLMTDKHIKYWAETPALPNVQDQTRPAE